MSAVVLSKYTVESQDDHKHLREVSHPYIAETPFRSPQLTLLDLNPDEWILYWRTPSYSPGCRHRVQNIEQLLLFELPPVDKTGGAEGTHQEQQARPLLHLVSRRKPG